MKGITLIISTLAIFSVGHSLANTSAQSNEMLTQQEYQAWLKEKFANQHEQLIPVVAVANMFYACNKVRKVDPIGYRVTDLITKMDRNQLADKLTQCLGTDSIQSDVAINFGLEGCFYEQLADKPIKERQEKMKLVKRAIASLSKEERQKSLTQCVTSQAIDYLK